jgi:zinc finger HIT domain-containing protein 1
VLGEVRVSQENHHVCANVGIVSHGKVTPSVKKILQSQKTFINHLSDFEAHLAIAGSTATPLPPAPATPIPRPTPGATPTNLMIAGKRSHKKKDQISVPAPTPIRKATSASQLAATPALANTKSEPQDKDTPMLDAPPSHIVLAPGNCKIPEPHPGDTDPLLISRIPGMPSQAEIEELLAQPPLTYAEARGPWVDEDSRKPVRIFCEVCGYWGRVRCTRCGGRVCALECLGVHQEECFTRYGA